MPGDKYVAIVNGINTEKFATQTSAGAADAGKIVALDSAGKLPATMMPVGFGDDVVSIISSENLAAGDFINIHNSSGAKVRKADASTTGKEAHGFVIAAVTAPAAADVYFEGTNNQVSGQTPGPVFLATTAGTATSVAPSGSGQVVQRLGVAISATAINFEPQPITVLA